MPPTLASPAIWTFTQARMMVFVLTLTRLSGLFIAMPGFGAGRLSLQIRVALVLVLALAIFPVVPPPATPVTGMWDLLGVTVTELAAGLLMGLCVGWITDTVTFAGQLMDTQMGFSFVQFIDPVTSHPVAISGSLLSQVTIVLILAFGLHHQMIRALVESYRILPMGQAVSVDPRLVISLMGQVLVKGFQLASPVLFVLFLVDFTAGIAGRFMPQLHLITLTFPLKIAVGLIVLGIVLREFGPWIQALMEAAPRNALRLLATHG
jgi:flagellar biosynthesis protein FliR